MPALLPHPTKGKAGDVCPNIPVVRDRRGTFPLLRLTAAQDKSTQVANVHFIYQWAAFDSHNLSQISYINLFFDRTQTYTPLIVSETVVAKNKITQRFLLFLCTFIISSGLWEVIFIKDSQK